MLMSIMFERALGLFMPACDDFDIHDLSALMMRFAMAMRQT